MNTTHLWCARYDTEPEDHPLGEDGVPVLLREGEGRDWTTVTFSGAIAVRFTPEDAITALMVEAYDCVTEVEHSRWLANLQKLVTAAYHVLPQSKRHFMLFFDHHGCLEVIADSVEVCCD